MHMCLFSRGDRKQIKVMVGISGSVVAMVTMTHLGWPWMRWLCLLTKDLRKLAGMNIFFCIRDLNYLLIYLL